MPNYVKRFKPSKTYLFIFRSGNVISNTEEGDKENEYLHHLSELLGNEYTTILIPFPKRKTVYYTSDYSKKKILANFETELKKINQDDNIVLLGISVGAEVITKYLCSNSRYNIKTAICIGLFIATKKIIKVSCKHLFFLYGGNDIVEIQNESSSIILKPGGYITICQKNIVALNSTTVIFKIISNKSHTLISQTKSKTEDVLKKIILNA